jgi:hypothetical protein
VQTLSVGERDARRSAEQIERQASMDCVRYDRELQAVEYDIDAEMDALEQISSTEPEPEGSREAFRQGSASSPVLMVTPHVDVPKRMLSTSAASFAAGGGAAGADNDTLQRYPSRNPRLRKRGSFRHPSS